MTARRALTLLLDLAEVMTHTLPILALLLIPVGALFYAGGQEATHDYFTISDPYHSFKSADADEVAPLTDEESRFFKGLMP